jgi:hypothetical protein
MKKLQVIEEEEEHYTMGVDSMDEMLEAIETNNPDDPSTAEVEAFLKLLKALEEPLHEHTEVTLLAFITQLMAIKSKYFSSRGVVCTRIEIQPYFVALRWWKLI